MSKEALELIEVPNFQAMLRPHSHYAKLAEKGPVVRFKTHAGVEVYVITQWDAALAALKDSRFSKSWENLQTAVKKNGMSGPKSGLPISGARAGNLLNTDPPDHTRLRNLVNLAFSPRRIESLRPRVEELVDGLISNLKGRDEADLLSEFAYPVGITMICELLGVPTEGRADFRDWATTAMSPGHPSQQESLDRLMGYLADLIATKKANVHPGDAPDSQPDILSAMIAARLANDALTESETLSMAYLMLVAGHETTVGLIGNAMLLLVEHPDQLKLLLERPSLINKAIEEVLRFDGSVHLTTMRATGQDVEVGGVTVPKGSFVQVLIGGCNRDARFVDPNRFDITREPMQHLAFGNGAHFCLGLHLARLEAQTAVGHIFSAFPDMQLAYPPEEIPWAQSVIRSATELKMRLHK